MSGLSKPPGDLLLHAVLDYGQASFEQGQAVARGDTAGAAEAQGKALAALSRLLPVQLTTNEPGE